MALSSPAVGERVGLGYSSWLLEKPQVIAAYASEEGEIVDSRVTEPGVTPGWGERLG